MPEYCPSCGAKVDEGYKFCLSCGAQLHSEDTKDSETSIDQNSKVLSPQQPIKQGGNTQPRKPNKVLFIALIAVIAIIIIVVVYLFTGGGVIDARFVGEWQQNDDFMQINWNFNSDGSLEMMGMNFANWSVKNNQLCFKIKNDEFWNEFIPEGSLDEVCYDFEFSDGGNTVYLSIDGSENFVLTKK